MTANGCKNAPCTYRCTIMDFLQGVVNSALEKPPQTDTEYTLIVPIISPIEGAKCGIKFKSKPVQYSINHKGFEWSLSIYNKYTKEQVCFNLNILLAELCAIKWPEPIKEGVYMSIPIEHSNDYHRARLLAGTADVLDEKERYDYVSGVMATMPKHLKVDFLWLVAVPSKPGSKTKYEWAIEHTE